MDQEQTAPSSPEKITSQNPKNVVSLIRNSLSNATLAYRMALFLFVISQILLLSIFANNFWWGLQQEGLGGLILVLIVPIIFIYYTVFFPLWILLLRKLSQGNSDAALLSMLFHPVLAVILLITIKAALGVTPERDSLGDIVSYVLSFVIFVTVFIIFFNEYPYAKKLTKEKKQTAPSVPVAKPAKNVPDETRTTTTPASSSLVLLFYAGLAFANFYVFHTWYTIASIPFTFVSSMSGSAFPLSTELFGIYFPTAYIWMLFEIPLAAFVTYKLFKKRYKEAYGNIVLVFYIVSIAFTAFVILRDPQQVIIRSDPQSVEKTYDFSQPVLIDDTSSAKHQVRIEDNLVVWVEHTHEYPRNVWEVFLFQFDPVTGKGTTKQLTNFRFTNSLASGIERESLKIIDGKIYWTQRDTNNTTTYEYDPATSAPEEPQSLPDTDQEFTEAQIQSKADHILKKYENLDEWDTDGTYVVYLLRTGKYTSELYLEKLPQ